MIAMGTDNQKQTRPRTDCLLVDRCQRCGGDHGQLAFTQLRRPIHTIETLLYTHWAVCPATGEPILATFVLGTMSGEDRE